ncbi:PD-(D/E)XK nuclease family protein [Enterococcus faecium]|uniref:PD-(D/E)XK nuclease family protein n=1 Tax=Enterococcus faecium TaxID=1352 RepID=UPI00207334A8|nr:PD-(D/E)XK nuclease family protein [Enterococcus faecium]MCM6869859.1 PD-(D/E)XK nuclease family protein [Enterococcus faecium]MCM6889259.1 PD-(D/E)XK nuclease family protein [Enterococcus faecium]MCM6891133.1 PD-(D/E)XK nuclease family protein [Enterococcus faecium]
MIDEKKCLKNLLEDMDDIEEKLSKWTGKTNIFQILKLSKNEIRHSNFLAFLFAPGASRILCK